MVTPKMLDLGARRLGEAVVRSNQIEKIQQDLFSLPVALTDVLLLFDGVVVFDNGAVYKPKSPCPLVDSRGFLDILMFLSLGSGSNSIVDRLSWCREEIDQNFIPIGEASGGNLICIDPLSRIYFCDHESPRGEGVYCIADSFDKFVDMLVSDNSQIEDCDGIIESETYFAF